ncbi:hypothetical protein CBL_08676 [Carabus blaptoides fortunei]
MASIKECSEEMFVMLTSVYVPGVHDYVYMPGASWVKYKRQTWKLDFTDETISIVQCSHPVQNTPMYHLSIIYSKVKAEIERYATYRNEQPSVKYRYQRELRFQHRLLAESFVHKIGIVHVKRQIPQNDVQREGDEQQGAVVEKLKTSRTTFYQSGVVVTIPLIALQHRSCRNMQSLPGAEFGKKTKFSDLIHNEFRRDFWKQKHMGGLKDGREGKA